LSYARETATGPKVRPGRQGVAYRLRPGRRTARRAVRPAIGASAISRWPARPSEQAQRALVLYGDGADPQTDQNKSHRNRPEQAHAKGATVMLLRCNISISTKPYQWH
jgi:hypothetical protein